MNRKWWSVPTFVLMAVSTAPVYGIPIKASLDPDKFGMLDQGKTNCPDTGCGPTAATNSLAYLQRMFPSIYDEKLIPDTNNNDMIDEAELIAVANDIGGNFMKTCSLCGEGTGTFIEDFILGKRDYIESKVPGKTAYSAQMNFEWRESPKVGEKDGTHPGTKKPRFVQDKTKPTLAFLASELMSGEDVELFLATTDGFMHYITLTSIEFDDTTNMGMFSFIDPLGGIKGTRNILGLTNGFIETDYMSGGANAVIAHAVSESIPEPSTVTLLSMGILGLLGSGWWRRGVR